MISSLEAVLSKVLLGAFAGPGLPQPDVKWVGFQPPDDDWRLYVRNLNHPALNVYLIDLREDRGLRSNQRVRTYSGVGATDREVPRRLTCHYLVSAWHHAPTSVQFAPVSEEHDLLYRAVGLLMNEDPFVPQEIFSPDPLPNGFPEEIRKAELPVSVVPPDGFPKYAEFWGTMGQVHPWKPAVYLTVTLPVILTEQFAGPMITTRITEYREAGNPASSASWIQIGGQLTVPAPENPARVWVGLKNAAGEVMETTTDAAGRYTFDRLRAGSYELEARPAGLPVITRTGLQIPSPTGEYDLPKP